MQTANGTKSHNCISYKNVYVCYIYVHSGIFAFTNANSQEQTITKKHNSCIWLCIRIPIHFHLHNLFTPTPTFAFLSCTRKNCIILSLLFQWRNQTWYTVVLHIVYSVQYYISFSSFSFIFFVLTNFDSTRLLESTGVYCTVYCTEQEQIKKNRKKYSS